MAIISIVPIIMGSLLNCFNAVLVRTSKKRKHLGSGFDIRQHMFDFSVKPPVGTRLKDHVQISEDDYEEYLRPTTRQSKKSHKKPPPNFDYFNEMLDELMDDDSKQTETTTDGGSSFKKDDEEEIKNNGELEELEDTQQGLGNESEQNETEHIVNEDDAEKEITSPPVRTGVSFNDYLVVFTDRAQKTKPAKSRRETEKPRQTAHEMRMAQKNNRIAILKVSCRKCPFEHTITKLVEDLKTEDYPKIVKYVESPECLSFHHLRNRCLQKMVDPVRHPSSKKMSHKEELMLKASALQSLPKIRKHRFSKIITPRGADVGPKKKKTTNKISHVDNSKRDKEPRSISQCEEEENTDKLIDEIYRSMDTQSKMSSIYIDTSLNMVEKANRPDEVIFDGEENIARESPTECDRAEEQSKSYYDQSQNDNEDMQLKETIDDILEKNEINEKTGEGEIADDEEDVSGEEIIDDVGNGPGLSDNESITDREERTDGISRKTTLTQPSAKTYSSGNATSALYQRPLVSFEDSKPPSVKKKKKKVDRAKTSLPKIDMSLVGRSHKSASLTKQRRANKEQRIAVVHDRCKKCCYELSIPKYEEDLTQDEKSKVEFIIDRSKSAKC
jgi:hypothetical protein